MAVRSKAYVCSCVIAGVTAANPAEDMDVLSLCLFVGCVGRGLRWRADLPGVRVCVCVSKCVWCKKWDGLGANWAVAPQKQFLLGAYCSIISSRTFTNPYIRKALPHLLLFRMQVFAIDSIFKGQDVQKDFLTFEDKADRLSRNVGVELPL